MFFSEFAAENTQLGKVNLGVTEVTAMNPHHMVRTVLLLL